MENAITNQEKIEIIKRAAGKLDCLNAALEQFSAGLESGIQAVASEAPSPVEVRLCLLEAAATVVEMAALVDGVRETLLSVAQP